MRWVWNFEQIILQIVNWKTGKITADICWLNSHSVLFKDGRMWAWCHHLQCSCVILWKVRKMAFSSPFAAVDAAQTNLPEWGHLRCGGGSLWESWWVEVCIEFDLFGSGSRSCGWYLSQMGLHKNRIYIIDILILYIDSFVYIYIYMCVCIMKMVDIKHVDKKSWTNWRRPN